MVIQNFRFPEKKNTTNFAYYKISSFSIKINKNLIAKWYWNIYKCIYIIHNNTDSKNNLLSYRFHSSTYLRYFFQPIKWNSAKILSTFLASSWKASPKKRQIHLHHIQKHKKNQKLNEGKRYICFLYKCCMKTMKKQ